MADRERLNAEVALFYDRKIKASTFRKEGGESAEERALAVDLFEGRKYADTALKGQRTGTFAVRLNGVDYLAAAGPLPGNLTQSPSGYVVLSSLSAARAPIQDAPVWVFALGLVCLLSVIAACVLTAMRFLSPLDKVERGVAEVINGNQNYVFEPLSPDFDGLANGLNVMLARLLGRPDPEEDDQIRQPGERWSGSLSVDDTGMPTTQQISPENEALAREPEGPYLQRLFGEYLDARRGTGENVQGLTLQEFSGKIRQNEAKLKAKFNCKSVRFKVVVKDGATNLKPVPIY
jgi:hypothetical protein